MSKIFTACFCLMLVAISTGSAQTKTTEETRTESQTSVDSTTGKKITTSAVTSISTKEDITPRQHMISTDPIKFFWMYNMSYHYALSKNLAVGGSIMAPTNLAPQELKGFGVEADAKIYFGNKPFRGFHLNPVVTVQSLSYDPSYADPAASPQRISETLTSTGLYMGWHWYWWEEFAVTFALGAEYNFASTKDLDSSPGIGNSKSGLAPGVKFKIGYSW